MRNLYFCRHGESVANAEQRYAGQLDTPLTDRGREQAKTAGEKAKVERLHIDLIVASPLIRALETAHIIATEIGYPLDRIITNPLLMERNLGSLQGLSWREYGEDDSPFTNIETLAALLARAEQALDYLRSFPEDNILVVSHGSLSRALRQAIHPDQTYHEELPNAEIVQLI